ncbi:hypothetical protein M501DRAFT_992410 [Patellaria atrata CBS 101060]|uniref:J domain-containing protein n=1 Tax=Patellaria atrata CBS 101060 TaxID=1346257 RepID=A0A9P4SBM7_9PEZI|nr:hypothetical protein M501DRAFT_992410 [Patellaria atrata CBS 101060]
MSNEFLSLAGWFFLPRAVGWLQSIYYGITIRAGEPKPAPGSPRFEKHRKNIHICLIVTYLLYTIYEADWQLQRQGHFYQLLGVGPDAEVKQIQSKFRRIAARFHPDKVPADQKLFAERIYVNATTARDTLIDPAKRFAYDRFGPDMLEWKQCITMRDYFNQGLQKSVQMYLASAFFLILWTVLGYMKFAGYWRYFAFVSMFILEFHTISQPTHPFIVTNILNPVFAFYGSHPPYVPFQIITIARKMTFASFVAVSQIAPLLQSNRQQALAQNAEQAQQQQFNLMDELGRRVNIEATLLLSLETTPFEGDEQLQNHLKTRVRNWLVQNTIRMDPQVRDAFGRALQKRREGVPAGAKSAGRHRK